MFIQSTATRVFNLERHNFPIHIISKSVQLQITSEYQILNNAIPTCVCDLLLLESD